MTGLNGLTLAFTSGVKIYATGPRIQLQFSWILISCCRYDHPNILSGQGTLGLEIVEEVPDLDAVVIPVGGGGLLAGVAVAVKGLRPEVQIIVRMNLHHISVIRTTLSRQFHFLESTSLLSQLN